MSSPPRPRWLVWAVVAAGSALSPTASAQAGPELVGTALDAGGAPLPDVPVVLHRVDRMGGAFIATDTTDGEGRFDFEVAPGDSAVYFAALRLGQRVYLGPAVQADDPAIADYVLRVDPANEAGAVASALSPAPRPGPSAAPTARDEAGGSDTGALLLVGALALASAGAFVFAAPRYRRRRTREALVELASIENELAGGADGDEAARLESARARIRERLTRGS